MPANGESKPFKEMIRDQLKGRGHMVDVLRTTLDTLVSVLPIVLFLLLFNFFVLKGRLSNPRETLFGMILTVIGLAIFVQGLKMGLIPLGQDVGENLTRSANVWVVLAFSFAVGYGVTLAEPALQALGLQVEELSAGVLKRQVVIHTVALGVGFGLVGGMLKIIFHIPTTNVIVPAFLITGVLAFFAPEAITGIAFDAAGVTTGPVTVPIIIALGVGMASALGGRDPLLDGFGLIALSSVGPILSVLILGIIFKL